MAEQLHRTQTLKKPDEITGILPELIKDIDQVETEFVKSLDAILESMTDDELAQLGAERRDQQTLQDKYNLAFRPETTIPRLGGLALGVATSSDFTHEVLARESLEAVDGTLAENERINKEFDDAVEAKRSQARSLIREFLHRGGDPSVLTAAGVHPEWVDALTARAKTRLEEYGNANSIPADELFGMTNVCAIGLVKAEKGITFGNHA